MDAAKREELRSKAEAIAEDIKGDFPDADVEYDLYVAKLGTTLRGVIDMGETFQRAYVWSYVNMGWKEDHPSGLNIRKLIKEMQDAGLV
jgi:hypothetical protein